MSWKLFSLECDFGRSGSLTGLFITRQETLDRYMGKRAYFGEVLGKHSDVWLDMDPAYIKPLSTDLIQLDLAAVEAKIKKDSWVTLSGYCPMAYIDLEGEDQ